MSRGRALAKVGDRQVPDRIVIPDLSGMIVAALLHQADLVGFTLVVAQPHLRIETLASSGRWVVAEQDPPAGAARYRGDTVVVVLRHDDGGSAGDREPRNPLPHRRFDREPPVDPTADPTPGVFGRSERPESRSPGRVGTRPGHSDW